MNFQQVFGCALVLAACVFAGVVKDKPIKAVITIQATNQTVVPNVVYTVDAVECLKEAYSIYVDDQSRAEAYAELFSAKHPGNWSVAIGYTTLLSHSTICVECQVDMGKDKDLKDLKDDKPKGVLVRIFN